MLLIEQTNPPYNCSLVLVGGARLEVEGIWGNLPKLSILSLVIGRSELGSR